MFSCFILSDSIKHDLYSDQIRVNGRDIDVLHRVTNKNRCAQNGIWK